MATQLARYGSKSARVRVFTTQELQRARGARTFGPRFRPTRIIIEHTPLAYEAHSAMPLAITSWGRAHSVPVVLVAHVEFGRACDPPEAAIAAALLGNGPLLDAGIAHSLPRGTSWARVIGERFRSGRSDRRSSARGPHRAGLPGRRSMHPRRACCSFDEVPQKMLAEIVEASEG